MTLRRLPLLWPLLLLLTGCAEPGWRTVEFVAIPRLQGGTCYVAAPRSVWNWRVQYADMVAKCAERSVVTNPVEESGT